MLFLHSETENRPGPGAPATGEDERQPEKGQLGEGGGQRALMWGKGQSRRGRWGQAPGSGLRGLRAPRTGGDPAHQDRAPSPATETGVGWGQKEGWAERQAPDVTRGTDTPPAGL